MAQSDKETTIQSNKEAEDNIIDQSVTDIDHLKYIEDMALELKKMAATGGYETLSGILDMASREARLRKAG